MLRHQLVLAAHVGAQDLGNEHAAVGLQIVLQERDEHTRRRDHGMFKGTFSAVRYDFPIRLADKGAQGCDRFEVFGHVMAELFNPGDYYDSSRPAWFIRWELIFSF